MKRYLLTYLPSGVFLPIPPSQHVWLRNTGHLKNTFWLESSRVGMKSHEVQFGFGLPVFLLHVCMYVIYLPSLSCGFWSMVLWDLRRSIACVFQRGELSLHLVPSLNTLIFHFQFWELLYTILYRITDPMHNIGSPFDSPLAFNCLFLISKKNDRSKVWFNLLSVLHAEICIQLSPRRIHVKEPGVLRTRLVTQVCRLVITRSHCTRNHVRFHEEISVYTQSKPLYLLILLLIVHVCTHQTTWSYVLNFLHPLVLSASTQPQGDCLNVSCGKRHDWDI